MRKVCEACGKPMEGTNPRKRFCDSTCRGRGHRGSVVPVLTEPVDLVRDLPVSTATRSALEAVDRTGTPAGAAALALAARIDANSDTGSALASMARELRAAMAEALAGATEQGDALDELSERRNRRVGS
jgi:hypothetical protein